MASMNNLPQQPYAFAASSIGRNAPQGGLLKGHHMSPEADMVQCGKAQR